MALIKTLEDLASWPGYRLALKEQLNSLEDGDPYYVSKDDFDFDVKNKPWPGRVVLFGKKGQKAMAALKKQGIQFREGTCRRDGKKLIVEGISGGLLKSANKTVAKLPIDAQAIVGSATAPEEPDVEEKKDDKPPAELKKEKTKAFGELKAVLATKPENSKEIVKIAKDAEAAEKAGKWEDATTHYENLNTALAIAKGADDEEEEELGTLENWAEYRVYCRQRFRKLPKDDKTLEPIYISRKKREFDINGKTWKGHAVLAGKKAKNVAKNLKKEGMLFLEGECYADGKEIVASGLPGNALKVAAKTLKMLKLGFTLRSVDGSIEEDDATTDDPMTAAQERASEDTASFGQGLVKYRRSLLMFAQAKSAAMGQLANLERQVAELPGEADLAAALQKKLTEIFQSLQDKVDAAINASDDEREPVTAAVRTQLAQAISDVETNAILKHIDSGPFGVKIQGSLRKALNAIQSSMPA